MSLSNNFFRVDLSSDKLHSISDNSKELLNSLDTLNNILNAEVYLSKKDLPAEAEKLRLALIEKLEEFKAYSNDNFRYKIIDMQADEVQYKIDSALRINEGLAPCRIVTKRNGNESITTIWPSMNLIMGEKEIPIQFLKPGTLDFTNYNFKQLITNKFISQIESKFIDGLLKAKQRNKKKISFLYGHGELGDRDQPKGENYVIIDALKKYYAIDSIEIKDLKDSIKEIAKEVTIEKYDSLINNKIESIKINNRIINLFDDKNLPNKEIANSTIFPHILNEIREEFKTNPNNSHYDINSLNNTDLLIVARPKTKFSEEEKVIIDQYIMNGGKVIWMLNMFEADENSLKKQPSVLTKPLEHDLSNFLYDYGVRFNANIVCDAKCAPVYRTDGLPILKDWFVYPVTSLPLSKFNKNILPVKLRYPCTVDKVGNDNNISTNLIEPSDIFRNFRQVRISYENTFNIDPNGFDNTETKPSIGWLIEGKFNSYYKDRFINEEFESFKKTYGFKIESEYTQMAFIGDGNLIKNDTIPHYDRFRGWPISLDQEIAYYKTPYFNYQYGNETFFLNLVDYMLEERKSLIPLRSKTINPKLLEKNISNSKKFWQIVNLIFPIIAVLLFAIPYWIIRKRKFGVLKKENL